MTTVTMDAKDEVLETVHNPETLGIQLGGYLHSYTPWVKWSMPIRKTKLSELWNFNLSQYFYSALHHMHHDSS